jgi:uncharacterized membrane protein YccC
MKLPTIPRPGRAEWLFSVRTFAAAMLALYIAFAFDLDRPYWAMASAYIASQPLSGATRSKAFYRLLGTVLGASATVVLVPNLVDAPALLSLALALWTGLCLYFALLDRTPRSYTFMLAGYTAAIVGFPSVSTPDAIFMTAVARVEEIGLGIACASVMASIVFPRRVQPVLVTKLDGWLDNAERWALAALAGEEADETVRADRQRLAGDIAEIDLLTSYLAWDPTAQPEAIRTLHALRRRMLTLLPVLSSLADRVEGLRSEGRLDDVRPVLEQTAAWLRRRHELPMPARLRDVTDGAVPANAAWADLLRVSLLDRLRELLDLVEDSRKLRQQLEIGGPFPAPLAYHRSRAAAEVQHRDHGRALWSAGSAALAVLVCCAFWIGSGWPDGAVATLDDPVPAIISFATWSVVAVAVDAVYLFALLPPVHDFPMLALALAPAYLLFGALTAMPATSGIGLALSANGATLLSLQSTYNAEFEPFINSAVALVVGMATAALVTAIVRSVGAEWSALRLLRRIWAEVAEAAARTGQGDRARFAGIMLDRIGLVAPRIAAAGPGSEAGAVDALVDLRIGLNIVTLRRVRRSLPPIARTRVEEALAGLAGYFGERARGRRAARPDRRRSGRHRRCRPQRGCARARRRPPRPVPRRRRLRARARLMAEISLGGGVLVPAFVLWFAIAFALSLVLRRLIGALGLYRFVWHRALFDLALSVLLLGGTVGIATRLVGP